MGGPMMGKSLSSLNYYVTKATNGLLVIPAEDSKEKRYGNVFDVQNVFLFVRLV